MNPKPKAYLRDRLYVPAEYVTEDMCGEFESKIEIGKDSLSGQLLYQTIQHYQIINALADQAYYAFNRGDIQKIFRVFSPWFEIIDERIEVPMRHPLKIVMPPGRDWYDYQPDAIDALMCRDDGLLKAPARSGKPVWEENLVLMQDGTYKRLKDIRTGDCVITHTGNPQRVLNVWVQGNLPTLRIKTIAGRETIAAHDHPFFTTTGFLQAKDLRVGMVLGVVADPILNPTVSRLDEEYRLAGYFIGDGYTAKQNATITCGDEYLSSDLFHCAKVLNFKIRRNFNSKNSDNFLFSGGVRSWLRINELAGKTAHTKEIPKWIFLSENKKIAQFIGAYFAGDGCISQRARKAKKHPNKDSDFTIEFYSVSKKLLQQVQSLLLRFRINSRLRQKRAKGYYKDGRIHISYGLVLSTRDDVLKFKQNIPVFGKKAKILEKIEHYPMEFPKDIFEDLIVEIEPAGELPCRCLEVEEDHTFTSDDLIVHNTLILCAAACAERQKTIVFAHQTDLLLQYMETFEKFTNLLELRRQSGERIVGLADDWMDFDELDVVFCTKQTFDHPRNRQKLPHIQRIFGYVQTDEAHLLSADLYSLYVNRFWARKRQGCSATPARKDHLQVVAQEIIGPIIHEIPIEIVNRVPVEVQYRYTGISITEKMPFVKLLTYLSELESRNELIARDMIQDVKDGHTIIAVTDRKEHVRVLRDIMRHHAVVETFTGDVQNRKRRKEILDSVRNGQAQVLIAMRNMTTGLDIPRADVFYNLLPSANAVSKGANAGEGGYEQQCSRVLTNFPGKEKAIIRDYIDNVGACWGCKKQREKTYRKIGAKLIGNQEKEKKAEQLNFILPADGARSNKF